jgi:hypothetical protein
MSAAGEPSPPRLAVSATTALQIRRAGYKIRSAGQCVFAGLFFLVGWAVLAGWSYLLLGAWRAEYLFVEHEGVVKEIRNEPSKAVEGHIHFSVAGRDFRVWVISPEGHTLQVGDTCRLWYNPNDPEEVVLSRWEGGWYLFLAFVLIVPVLVIFFAGRALRRAIATWGQPAPKKHGRAPSSSPAAPGGQKPPLDGANSSTLVLPPFLAPEEGQVLPVRLRRGMTTFGCNGVILVIVLLVFYWQCPDVFAGLWQMFLQELGLFWWVALLIAAVAALAALARLFRFLKFVLVALGVPRTVVEISSHPLKFGETYQIYVCQRGPLSLRSLRVLLVCDQKTTSWKGQTGHKNLETMRRRLFERELFRDENIAIQRDTPFEVRCELHIPERIGDAIQPTRRNITWKLVVEGSIAGWPGFLWDYPVIVQLPQTS